MYSALGTLGYVLLAICYLPQIVKTYKLKVVDEISFLWLLMLWTGLGLVQIYLIVSIKDRILTIGNFAAWIEVTVILIQWWWYK